MTDVTAVPSIDLSRYLGVWYEIARVPMRHEKPDYTDITATYTLNDDGNVRVRNRALDGDGEVQAIGELVPDEPQSSDEEAHAAQKENYELWGQ